MNDFFDSSWLIAALVKDESDHEVCLLRLEEAISRGSALAAQHSLAEIFHTLTGKKDVPPDQAVELMEHNFADLRWIALNERDYWKCLRSAHRLGIRGGAIYDALLLAVAEKENAERIHTINKSHFIIFSPR